MKVYGNADCQEIKIFAKMIKSFSTEISMRKTDGYKKGTNRRSNEKKRI